MNGKFMKGQMVMFFRHKHEKPSDLDGPAHDQQAAYGAHFACEKVPVKDLGF